MPPSLPVDLPTDGLVSARWLLDRHGTPGLVVLDGSWHLPTADRDPVAEFSAERIPGARFFPLDALSDPGSPLPHMLPAPEHFAAGVGSLGIGNDDTVVIYDTVGIFSSARPWWMFRVFGHDRVAVLDGGLPAWKALGGPVESGPSTAPPGKPFATRFRADKVRIADQVAEALDRGVPAVVDVRAGDRFAGIQPEPRPEVRSGHMPGARNLPFTDLLAPGFGPMLPADVLEARFAAAGIPKGPVITSCGSGVTACVAALATMRMGWPEAAVYDGSWTEWGTELDRPVAIGPA